MRLAALLMLICLFPGTPPRAGEAAPFAYWVLALSWSPSFCAQEAAADDAQCVPGAGQGFVVHGLWPQHETGWPEYCDSDTREPSRRDSAGMADLLGSGGRAFYQWRKHGRCSGLSGPAYYAATREAAATVAIPEVFSAIARPLRVPVPVIEDAFIEANPGLTRDAVTVTCKSGALREVRICLDRGLRPRDCGRDVVRDCALLRLDLPAPR